MELRNLVSFKTVAKTHSFSKAAQELGYVQSTITFQIKQLEEELQTPLFDRIGPSIRLTEAGTIFLDYASQIIALAEESKQVLLQANTPMGSLRLMGISSLCMHFLPTLIKDYCRLYPQVTISTTTASAGQIIEGIKSGTTDIGLFMDFNASIPDFLTGLTFSTPLAFFCSSTHLLATSTSLTLGDLVSETFITTEPTCSYRKLLSQLFEKEGLIPTILFESENTEVIKRFTLSNLGITFLPEIAVKEELANGTLYKLPVALSIPSVYIHIVYKKKRWLSPSMEQFLQLISLKSLYLKV